MHQPGPTRHTFMACDCHRSVCADRLSDSPTWCHTAAQVRSVSQEELGSLTNSTKVVPVEWYNKLDYKFDFNQQKLSVFLSCSQDIHVLFGYEISRKRKGKDIWYTTTCLWHNLHNLTYYEVLYMHTCTRECVYLCMSCCLSRSRSTPGYGHSSAHCCPFLSTSPFPTYNSKWSLSPESIIFDDG